MTFQELVAMLFVRSSFLAPSSDARGFYPFLSRYCQFGLLGGLHLGCRWANFGVQLAVGLRVGASAALPP